MHLVPIPRRPVDWKQIWASPVRLSVTQGADQTTAIKALQCCLGSGLPVRERVWASPNKKISHFHASSLERQSLCSCMILAMMNAQETVNGIRQYTCCWACYLSVLENGKVIQGLHQVAPWMKVKDPDPHTDGKVTFGRAFWDNQPSK